MNKTFSKIALAGLLILPIAASAQDVVVRVAPPARVYERVPPRPYPDGYWIRGYHRWDGARYVWVGGHYEHRPHPGAVWVDGRWDHRGGGYFWREGHWR